MSEYTREEILKLIEENDGPEGLDLSGKDLLGIKLSREKIVEELEKARESAPDKTPVWYCDWRGGGINLQGANLQGAILNRAKLHWACLWGANLKGAKLQSAVLKEALLGGADLEKVYLAAADLKEAYLGDANLQGADLSFVRNLDRAYLRGANLQGAHLESSHLEKGDLFAAKSLKGAYFHNVFLDKTRMRRKQLGKEIGEEVEGKYDEAKEAYLALKNNFAEIGHHNDAAWAYRKERRMEKLTALEEARYAWQARDWKRAIRRYAKVASDQFVEWVCDYGEGFWNVVGSLIAVWLAFTLIYVLVAGVWGPWQDTGSEKIRYITRNPIDLLWFSLGTMVTLHPPGLEARSTYLMRFLVPSQALLGIFLAGLLGFVLGNRIRRS